MSRVRVRHSIRRGSSGVVRSLELKDGDENSCSDTESIDDRASIASSVPGTVEGDTTSIINNVPASTVADHVIEKLVIENNIFLKAALQLLDQRDRSIDQNSKTGKSNDGSSADVIMCGKLKKASSGAVARIWKDKFVELRHGVLCYEDITAWGQKANKKTVQLMVRQVLCRPSHKYHGHVFEIRDLDSEGHVVHHHSRKKLFMAESSDEMARWIEAIRTAMIGSAGDFGANMDTRSGSGGEDNHTVLSDESDVHQHRPSGSGGALEDWRPLHTLQMGSNDSGDGRQAVSSLPKMFTSARKVKKGNQPSSFSSEGIESFSSEMKRFEYIKRIIHAASTPQEYRECLLDQALDNGITIPVAYMKKFLRESSMGNFSLRTTGSEAKQELDKKEKTRVKLEKKAKRKQGQKIRKSVFGSSNSTSGNSSGDKHGSGDHNLHWNLTSKATTIENSQAWKDLFRDTISVNGDLVNGGVDGPEAMIGALVRHILLQVHRMREKWVSYQEINAHVFSAPPVTSSIQSEQEARFERARMMAAAYPDLDEGQALSIARDILLSCNRTESGGDTYYCTQSLLCNSNFAVLTPHGCDVDPIEIVVDVVESSRRRSSEEHIRPCSSSSVHSVHSVHSLADSPGSGKELPGILYHHLSGINELSTGSPRNNSNNSDADGEEGFGALRDSTTVETDTISDNSSEQNLNLASQDNQSQSQSHYPDSLLNAAAATVKRDGQRLGDIDDYYDPAQLALQSDIPGASAIPSNMLLMKEVSKRKKRLSQPGYVDICDSDNSMCESTSGDSKSNGSEKDSSVSQDNNHDSQDSNSYHSPPTRRSPPPIHQTPVFHINCDDDVTLAVSELTMDTVPTPKPKTGTKKQRSGSLSAMSNALRKNLGFATAEASTDTSDDVISSPITKEKEKEKEKKRHSIFGFSTRNSEEHEHTPVSSPHPHSHAHPEKSTHSSSWRSTKSNDDDASSVTDHRQYNHNHNHNHSHRHHHDEDCEEESAAQAMCIRIQVIVKSRYRLCNLDPQDENEDTWANMTSEFHQHFFLKSKSNGRPAVSDRFVTVKVDDPTPAGH